MEAAEARPAGPPPNRLLTVILLAVIVLSACLLFYGPDLGASYGGYLALLVIPAALGGLVSQLADSDARYPLMGCYVWPTLLMVGAVGVGWLVLGEGVICIAMILPPWIVAAVAGALVNRWNAHRVARWNRNRARLHSAAWLAFPLLLASGELVAPPAWQEMSVTREIDIAAAPRDVWPLLVNIPSIAPGEGRPNFTQDVLGIPRPSEARLERRSEGLIRQARWGREIRFEERIVGLRRHEAIAWEFAFPDDSLQRHTDRHISPDGPVLKILSGKYELEQIGPRSTTVRLTTRYRMRAALPSYLSWWGEILLGDIQENVLGVVKDRAEGPARGKV